MKSMGSAGHSAALRRQLGGAGGVVALLIVAAIIMVLSMRFFITEEPTQQASMAVTSIDRSADVTCETNRNAIRTDLTMWQVNNPGERLRLDDLRQKYSLPACPRGGAYVIGTDGVVYCTKHFPPPPEMMNQVMALTTPAPEPTPFGSPTPLGASASTPPPAPTPLVAR